MFFGDFINRNEHGSFEPARFSFLGQKVAPYVIDTVNGRTVPVFTPP